MSSNIKEDNAIQYNKKINNKTNRSCGKRSWMRNSHTNTTSFAKSRPTHYRQSFHRQLRHDVQHHHTQDQNANLFRVSKKYVTPAHIDKPTLSSSSSKKHTAAAGASKMKRERLVALPAVHPNLFLGNIEAAQNANRLQEHNIKVIFNYSDDQVRSIVPQPVLSIQPVQPVQVYDFTYHDTMYHNTKYLDYDTFLKLVTASNDLLSKVISDGNILLVCNAGVNRSVSIAVGFAVSRGQSSAKALHYIDMEKYKTDKTWNNLTNFRIRQLVNGLTNTELVRFSSTKDS
jgi:protein-tyrosine phosphatase